MKIRKIIAVMLAISLIAASIQIPAFADVLENEENTEIVMDTATLSETGDNAEGASPSDAEYIEDVSEEKASENETKAGELPDAIVLTAEASDGVIVTMKAETSAFVSAKTASPSDAEEKSGKDEDEEKSEKGVDAASSSGVIRADEFDPELLTLSVEVIEEKDEEAVDEALEKETKDDNIASRRTYDICVLYNGEKIEPLPGKKAEVSFKLTDAPSGADEVKVYHHTEDGVETIIDEDTAYEEEIDNGSSDAEEPEVIVVTGGTDSFSFYTIDFTYNEKTVSIPGDTTENSLADILKKVGIEGIIVDAKAYQDTACTELAEEGIVKNEEGDVLFKIYEAGDVWYVDAISSFDTEHGLYVKTENAEYKIKVTDDQNGNVCKIGDTGYATVQAAVTASAGTSENPVEIDMIADSTENVSVASGKYIILDLNGCVLKGSGTGGVITNSGTLTIKDSYTGIQQVHNFKVGSDGLWTLTTEEKTVDYEDLTARPEAGAVVAVKGGAVTGGNATSGSAGVHNNAKSKFTLEGGNIIGNTTSENGGGVYANEATITITGGAIIGNRAKGTYTYGGGGILIDNSEVQMSSGTISFNYTPLNGGGVYAYRSSKFTMSGGYVSYNTVGSNESGGGVYNTANSIFTMSGGIISGNSATYGGGIHNTDHVSTDNCGTVIMTGGTITGNVASSIGAGVYYRRGTMKVGGTARVTGNVKSDSNIANNVYLGSGKTITVVSPQLTDACIGVTTAAAPSSAASVAITGENKDDYSSFFTLDRTRYAIENVVEGDKHVLKLRGDEFVCEIGSTQYSYIADALSVVPGGESKDEPTVIKLIKNDEENITVSEERYITLDLNGYVLKGSGTGGVITNSGTLTITDSDTGSQQVHNFRVGSDGLWTLTTEEKTVDYEDLTARPEAGAVVAVNGGAVTGGNATSSGAGVHNNAKSKFTLEGGSIIGNTTSKNAGGVYADGVTIAISGGAIIGNRAAGSYGGGGVLFDSYSGSSVCTMSGGAISFNYASSKSGGGVYNYRGTKFTMSGGVINYNLAADNGGGVVNYYNNASFEMSGGSISNNTANSASYGGGGVYNNSAVFTMSGDAVVSGNTAKNGAGMYNYSGTTTINGGTVRENKASNSGGGVYYAAGTFNVGGSAKITGNIKSGGTVASNVYLPSGKTITVDSTNLLTSGASIGVTTAASPTVAAPVNITGKNGADYHGNFTSDSSCYSIRNSGSGDEQMVQLAAIAVCKIGETQYGSIAEALNAAHTSESSTNPTTIALINDDTENVTIPGDDASTEGVDETRYITLDLTAMC